MNFYPAPYHIDGRDVSLYLLGIGLSAVALLAALIRREWRRPPDATDGPIPFCPTTPLVVCVIFLVIQSYFHRFSVFQLSGDEYARSDFGFSWAKYHFFGTHDHVWLAGQFYVLGLLYQVMGSLETAVSLSSTAGMAVLAIVSTDLAYRLWRHRLAALFAGLFVCFNWMIFWTSTNAVAEVFFLPLLMLTLNLWVTAWIAPAGINREYWLLGVAVCNGLGNMFRFESWYIGIPLGCFFLVRLIMAVRGGQRWPMLLLPLVSAALIATYPVGHVVSSWVHFGSPTAFLSTASSMNEAGNLFYDTDTVMGKLLNYPKSLWLDHWYLIPPGIAGLLVAGLRRREPGVMMYHAAVGTIYAVAILISLKAGIGSNTRARYTMFLLLPLVIYSGQLIVILSRAFAGRWGVALACLAILAYTPYQAYTSVNKARMWYANGYNMMGPDVAFLMQLRHEHDRGPRHFEAMRIHPLHSNMYVFSHGDALFKWAARYHSPQPENVHYLWDVAALNNLVEYPPDGAVLAIRKPMPEGVVPDAAYHRVMDLELWEVWHRGPQDSAVAE